MRLILASISPRRRELLTAAGFTFEVIAPGIDESVRPGESGRDHVHRLAVEKSAVVFERLHDPDAVVLGADTSVVVEGRILGKPADDDESRGMITLLSGRSHEVMTGISVRTAHAERHSVETTTVWFTPLSRDEIEWYVGTGEGRDKAGAYAIQGLASRFIPQIEGSYSNVVGLPVAAVWKLLAVASPEHAGLS